MGKIKLLDCTLRDGGYVNDWKFGYDNILCIFERLIDSKVDIIEIGFLDERRPFDRDRSIMPNTDCMETIYGKRKNENTQIVGMIDYGTCSLKHIRKCSESCLDGIRVIFKKHLMNPAMEYCRQIKALGYKVYAQLVSITDYNDDELMEVIKLVNDVQPLRVLIVADVLHMGHPADIFLHRPLLTHTGRGFLSGPCRPAPPRPYSPGCSSRFPSSSHSGPT